MRIDGNSNPFFEAMLPGRRANINVNISVSSFRGGSLTQGAVAHLQGLCGNCRPQPPINDPHLNFIQKALGMIANFLGSLRLPGFGNGQRQALPPQYKAGAGAINKVSGKAAGMATDPKIRGAMEFMQTQQAKSPGQTIKQTVKGSDGKKYNLRLDPNGNFDIKPKSSFFGSIGKFFGGIAKGALKFAGGLAKGALNFASGGLLGGIGGFANKLLGGIGGKLFGGVANKLLGGIGGFANKLIGGLGGKFLGVAKKLLGGLGRNLLGGVANKVFGGISGFANKFIGSLVNKIVPIVSNFIPGGRLISSGLNFLNGLSRGR